MYADTHIRDDDTLDMGAAEIDQWLGIPNFCSTLPDDWLIEIDESTVELPGFQSHNGVDAKKKALTAKRVERHRKGARNGPALQVKEPCNAPALPDQTRPDQTKPDHKNKEGAASPAPVGLDLPAWERWVEYRKAIRKPLKPVSIPAAQRELAAFGAEQAAVVEQSVANGWQGLFALKPKSANGKPQERRIETPPTQDQVEAARRKAAEQNLLNARLAGVLKQVSA
jgi:hypothetical protein